MPARLKGPYEFGGGTFRTLGQIARRHGVTVQRVSQWLKAGKDGPPDPESKGRPKPVRFMDRDWGSVKECSGSIGYSANSIRKWLKAGLDAPPGNRRRGPYEFGGRTFGTQRDIAEFYGTTQAQAHLWLRDGLAGPPREFLERGRMI